MTLKNWILILLLAIVVVSCEDREPEAVIVPEWLKPRLEELENSGNCFGCQVQRWTYNDEYFYHVYCGYWSCSNCEIYNYNGDLVVWGEGIDHLDFDNNKKRPIKVWECGDEL